jgi:hypothetical protein
MFGGHLYYLSTRDREASFERVYLFPMVSLNPGPLLPPFALHFLDGC